jgi:ER lumen protein retaining receptor
MHTQPSCHSPTHDPAIDTFRADYLVAPCAVLGFIFNYSFTPTEILWSFSIFLESVAILPQLFMLQRTGEAETITTHYLAALGAYRALYIPNWIYRCGFYPASLCSHINILIDLRLKL